MTRGRKPDALAVRREKDHVDVAAEVIGNGCEKPMGVACNNRLSRIWDDTIGSGMAFTPSDAPILEQFVFDLALAEECRCHMFDESGTPAPFITATDDDGNTRLIDNPYYKKMREVSADVLKLAGELGLTPIARARLGLTQASAKAVNISIAETIRKAMERQGV